MSLARDGIRAAQEGRLVTEGWAETLLLPRFDINLLTYGEMNNSLSEVLSQLIQQSSERVTVIRCVIQPIWFQAILLAVVSGMLYYSHLWVEVFIQDALTQDQMLLFNVSKAFQQISLPLCSIMFCWLGLVAFGRSRCTDSARRLLLPFDRDWRLQLGASFSRVAELLHRNGASHKTVTRSFSEISRHIPFVRRVTPRVLSDLSRGIHYADAIADRVLPTDQAQLVKSLAPGESREQFAAAFRVVGQSMTAVLKRKYQRWLSTARVLLLTSCAAILLILIYGMYDVTVVMASVISRY